MSIYGYERVLLRNSFIRFNMRACLSIRLRTGTLVCVLSGMVYDIQTLENRHKSKDMDITHKILFAIIKQVFWQRLIKVSKHNQILTGTHMVSEFVVNRRVCGSERLWVAGCVNSLMLLLFLDLIKHSDFHDLLFVASSIDSGVHSRILQIFPT